MTDPEQLKTHAALFDRMGKAMGLDLEEEAVSGTLQFEEIAEAVLRCTRCAHPETCQKWLHSPARADEAADTPDYCRNRDLLGYLREPVA